MDRTLDTIEIEKSDLSQEMAGLTFDEAGNATQKEILMEKSDNPNNTIEVHQVENLESCPETVSATDTNPTVRPTTPSSQGTSRTADDINIDQPLALFESIQHLTECITRFATRHGVLNKLDVLIRSAEVERDKYSAIGEPGFPEHERTALTDEAEASFWHQSRSLRAACLVVGVLSAACQGIQQSVIGGSALAIAEEFGLHVKKSDPLQNNHDLWILGLLTAIVSLSSGILSLFIADPLQSHWFGRRGAIAVSTVVGAASIIGAACCHSIPQLLGCRILTGASLGAKSSVIAPFLAELSPVHIRGGVLSIWQIGDAFGIFCGFVGYYIIEHNTVDVSRRWRLLTLTSLLPAIPLLFATYMVPESYIFLLKKGKYKKALESACSYRKIDLLGCQNVVASHFQMEAEEQLARQRRARRLAQSLSNTSPLAAVATTSNESVAKSSLLHDLGSLTGRLPLGPPGCCPSSESDPCCHHYQIKERNFYQRLWHVFEDARCRRALISGSIIMGIQALCGINVFAFFSSSTINAGIRTDISLTLAVVFGSVNFTFGLLTPYLTNRLGRTTLVLVGLPIMSIFMFILASVFQVENSSRTSVILLFAFLFTAVYSFTLGPAAYTLPAESFGSSVREICMAICVFVNTTSLGIMLLVYPFVTAPIGYTASLCIFGFIDVLGFVACLLFCIDTRDRTLDELQYSFDLPLSVHCEYRLLYVLPEAWAHYSDLVLRFFRKRERRTDVESNTGSSVFSTETWGLVPYHRWARIHYLSAPSSRIRRFLRPAELLAPDS